MRFFILSVLIIGIIMFSGCIGQDDEETPLTTTPTPTTTTTTTTPTSKPTTGIAVQLSIQPNPIIPSLVTAFTLTDYRIHSSWADAITDDENGTRFQWNEGTTSVIDRIYWQWDVGYPDAMSQINYDIEVKSDGPIYGHTLKIYERDGGESTIFSVQSNITANGTWTSLSAAHWINGKIFAHYEFEEDLGGFTYITYFDVMRIEFNLITEEQQTILQYTTENDVHEVLYFTINQNDVDVTISGIPTSYQLIQITPESSYQSISNNIAASGNIVLRGCLEGTYQVILQPTQ